jgi:ankyrin repeat protein
MKKIKHFKSRIIALSILGLTMQTSQAALVDLAEYQDWDALQTSISSEDVNAVQPDGMTALLWAAYYDETDVVRLLLNAGATPNVSSRYGITPLIQAAMNGNDEMVNMLVDAGADVNATTPEGDNAILNAARTGAVQGLQALIDAGADVNYRDGYLFQTPLMWAAAANQAAVLEILSIMVLIWMPVLQHSSYAAFDKEVWQETSQMAA